MSRQVHPLIKEFLEAMLPGDQVFHAMNYTLFKRGFDRSICTLAVALYFVGPEVLRQRTKGQSKLDVFAIDELIAQVSLLAIECKDFGFFSQLAEALEQLSSFDERLEKASADQLDLVDACDEVIRAGKKLTFSNVWDVLMEEPFNWHEKFGAKGDVNVRRNARKSLKDIGIELESTRSKSD